MTQPDLGQRVVHDVSGRGGLLLLNCLRFGLLVALGVQGDMEAGARGCRLQRDHLILRSVTSGGHLFAHNTVRLHHGHERGLVETLQNLL